MKKIIIVFCTLLSLFYLSFAQEQDLNDIKDKKIEKFDFVVFFPYNKIPLRNNRRAGLYTGKINHEKLKRFFSHYVSVSSSGLCPYTYYFFLPSK